jgi:2-methylcitrate dehydratase PrpD
MVESQQSLSAEFISDLLSLNAQLDHAALDKARECLLDFLGVAIAGAHELSAQHESLLKQLGSEKGAVKAIGCKQKTNLITAALLNGMSAHQLELDDGHRYGMVHPGATVIAALLPLAQQVNATNEALLRAIVIGYEASIRLAMAVQPGMKHRGYHATGTCGAIGAAIGAGLLMGHTAAQLHVTLCVAATQAAGLLQVIREGSSLKPFNAGQAALHGVLAATMGSVGHEGPQDVLGGQQGLLNILSDTAATGPLKDISRKPPAIHGIYVKPYAACRHCHPAIDAALVLRSHSNFSVGAVKSVQVHTYGLAVHLHDHQHVRNSADARMSTPYSVAAALYFGVADMEQFGAVAMGDVQLQRLLTLVNVQEDPALSLKVPRERSARVCIHLEDGANLEHTVSLPKGEPENPLTPKERESKFAQLASFAGLPKALSVEIIACVKGNQSNLTAMTAQL